MFGTSVVDFFHFKDVFSVHKYQINTVIAINFILNCIFM